MIIFIIRLVGFIYGVVILISTLMACHSYDEAMKAIDKLEQHKQMRWKNENR